MIGGKKQLMERAVSEGISCLKESADFLKEPGNHIFGREVTCLYWSNREETERGGQALFSGVRVEGGVELKAASLENQRLRF